MAVIKLGYENVDVNKSNSQRISCWQWDSETFCRNTFILLGPWAIWLRSTKFCKHELLGSRQSVSVWNTSQDFPQHLYVLLVWNQTPQNCHLHYEQGHACTVCYQTNTCKKDGARAHAGECMDSQLICPWTLFVKWYRILPSHLTSWPLADFFFFSFLSISLYPLHHLLLPLPALSFCLFLYFGEGLILAVFG